MSEENAAVPETFLLWSKSFVTIMLRRYRGPKTVVRTRLKYRGCICNELHGLHCSSTLKVVVSIRLLLNTGKSKISKMRSHMAFLTEHASPRKPKRDCISEAEAVSSFTVRADCACGAGPVFETKLKDDGTVAAFAESYPNAPGWIKKLAAQLR